MKFYRIVESLIKKIYQIPNYTKNKKLKIAFRSAIYNTSLKNNLIFSSLSGYDIRETVKIWERMKAANKGKEPSEFMSTHPSSANRIKNINGWTNQVIMDYPPILAS